MAISVKQNVVQFQITATVKVKKLKANLYSTKVQEFRNNVQSLLSPTGSWTKTMSFTGYDILTCA